MEKIISTLTSIIIALSVPAVASNIYTLEKNNLVEKITMGEKERDFYSSEEEIKEEYEHEYFHGQRRINRIEKEDDKYIGICPYANGKVEVPKEFIDNVIKHLEQAKKEGYFDYIFYSDLSHCHHGLPKEHFEKEYEGLTPLEIRKKSFEDDKLMVLYHSRELLERSNIKIKKRNFLGYFDGRNINLIHPKKGNKDNTVFDYDREEMQEYDDYQSIGCLILYFKAHKDGLFQLSDGTRFDIDI